MIHPARQHAAYENIEMNCISMASVRATQSGYIMQGEQKVAAIQGVTLEGESITLFPGEVPRKLPDPDYWQRQAFDFTAFRPLPTAMDEPCQHIRVDKALDILIGDKLR
ncbi:TPA: YcjX family protein, partial [Vibrio cholerae]